MTKLIIKMYLTDLTETEWQYITKVLNLQTRKRKYDLRMIWNGIFYLVKTGCQWRMFPKEFPQWESVYYYYRKWASLNVFDLLLDRLRGHVRVERRKGEEHREIDVCRRDVQANAGDKVDDEGEYLGENDAGEEKYRELRRTPVALQRVADEIIKIESEQGEKIKADGVEYEADEPPDLPVQNGGRGERQVAHQNGIDKTQQPEHDVSADDVFHQVRDAEVRVLIAEAIDIVHGLFHIEFLLGNAGRFARRVCAM